MMQIKLLSDYRGVLTNEQFYVAGTYKVPDEMPQGHADALVEAERAAVVESEPEAAPKPKAAAASKGRRTKAK